MAGAFSKIKFGDGFVVTDEGGGIITVAGTGGGNGGGGGITSIDDNTPSSLTGLLKGNGTDVDVAVAGTDYATPAQLTGKVDRDAVELATARLVAVKLAAPDTQPAFRILGDGKHEWGQGGGSAPDARLYRISAANLQTDTSLAVGGSLVVGKIDATGAIYFGPTLGAKLHSPSTGNLKTDTSFIAGGSIVIATDDPNGAIYMGPNLDVKLLRAGNGVLRTDGEFELNIAGVGNRRIVVGAPDTGGAGYRMLRVAN